MLNIRFILAVLLIFAFCGTVSAEELVHKVELTANENGVSMNYLGTECGVPLGKGVSKHAFTAGSFYLYGLADVDVGTVGFFESYMSIPVFRNRVELKPGSNIFYVPQNVDQDIVHIELKDAKENQVAYTNLDREIAYVDLRNENFDELAECKGESDSSLAYIIELEYKNDMMNLIDVDIGLSYLPDKIHMPESAYDLELISAFDDVLYEYSFEPHTITHLSRKPECFSENYYDSECDSSPSFYDSKEDYIVLTVPYSGTGSKIKITDSDGNVVQNINLEENGFAFSNYCGDGVCSSSESFWTCPIECPEELILREQSEGLAGGYIKGDENFKVTFERDDCKKETNLESPCVEDLLVDTRFFQRNGVDWTVSEYEGENIEFQTDYSGTVLIESENSNLFQRENGLIAMQNDWSKLPNAKGNFKGVNEDVCSFTFNPDNSKPIEVICNA